MKEFTTFLEFKEIVRDLTEWAEIIDISCYYYLHYQRHFASYSCMKFAHTDMERFMDNVLNKDDWSFLFHEQGQGNRDQHAGFIDCLTELHACYQERRIRPGGEEYEKAKLHFEKMQ